MRSPAVSVIIPCYNAEKYLDMCMESLLNQTLRDIEIICIDDGSTDYTLDKLNNYAKTDSRLRIFSQKNQFAGAARNLGLSQAKGEYLLFLDSDDFFEENLVEDAYAAGISAAADVVLFNAQCFDDASNEFKKGWFLNTSLIPEKQPFCLEDCPDHFYQITTPVPWTKLFRRQFLLDTKLQFQNLRNTNDVYFVFSALAVAKRIVTLDKVLVAYRIGQKTNLQSTKNRTPFCFYSAYKALHDKLGEYGLLHTLYRSYANQVLGGCLYNLRSMNDLESLEAVFNKLREEFFDKLEIPDHDVSFFFIEANYYEMRLIKKGTFAQYLAFCESERVREVWYSIERAIIRMQSCRTVTTAYKLAVTSAVERIIKALENCDADDSNDFIELAYQIVHEAFNRQEFAEITIQSFENHLLYQKFSMIQHHGYNTIKAMLSRKLIVSMTSYPGRIDALAPVLDSLFNQDRKADEILLWLAKEEFPGMEQDLPEYLVQLVAQNRISIRWCDNLKPHKKYFYALQEYTEDIIVTVDDDLIYSSNLLSSLYNSYLQYPQAVSAVRVHLMLLSEDNRILPYNTWIRETDCCLYTPSMQLFATGGAGALYPPNLFRKEFFDWTAISAHCPIADDLWLKAMELISGVPVVAARSQEPLQYLPGSQADALKQINDVQKYNDVQLENIIRWTDEKFGPGSLIRNLTEFDGGETLLGMQAVSHHLDRERKMARSKYLLSESKLKQLGDKQKKTCLQLEQTEAKLQHEGQKLQQTQQTLWQSQQTLQQTERKLQQTEENLARTNEQLRWTRDHMPIGVQMQDLGEFLRQKRESSNLLLWGCKYAIYLCGWIPLKLLTGTMYFLKNGFKATAKRIISKLFRRG